MCTSVSRKSCIISKNTKRNICRSFSIEFHLIIPPSFPGRRTRLSISIGWIVVSLSGFEQATTIVLYAKQCHSKVVCTQWCCAILSEIKTWLSPRTNETQRFDEITAYMYERTLVLWMSAGSQPSVWNTFPRRVFNSFRNVSMIFQSTSGLDRSSTNTTVKRRPAVFSRITDNRCLYTKPPPSSQTWHTSFVWTKNE